MPPKARNNSATGGPTNGNKHRLSKRPSSTNTLATPPSCMDKPKPPNCMDKPKPPNCMDKPKPPNCMDKPKPPNCMDKPKHPNCADKPKHPNCMDKPKPPNCMDKPKPPNCMDKPKHPNCMDKPKPPNCMDKPKPPNCMDKPKPPNCMDKPKPPNCMDKPKPPNCMDKPKPPNCMDKPKPPNCMDKPKPPNCMDKPKHPNCMDKPKHPNCMDKPKPPNCMDKPKPPNCMDKPKPPNCMDKPKPPNCMDKPKPPSSFNKPKPEPVEESACPAEFMPTHIPKPPNAKRRPSSSERPKSCPQAETKAIQVSIPHMTPSFTDNMPQSSWLNSEIRPTYQKIVNTISKFSPKDIYSKYERQTPSKATRTTSMENGHGRLMEIMRSRSKKDAGTDTRTIKKQTHPNTNTNHTKTQRDAPNKKPATKLLSTKHPNACNRCLQSNTAGNMRQNTAGKKRKGGTGKYRETQDHKGKTRAKQSRQLHSKDTPSCTTLDRVDALTRFLQKQALPEELNITTVPTKPKPKKHTPMKLNCQKTKVDTALAAPIIRQVSTSKTPTRNKSKTPTMPKHDKHHTVTEKAIKTTVTDKVATKVPSKEKKVPVKITTEVMTKSKKWKGQDLSRRQFVVNRTRMKEMPDWRHTQLTKKVSDAKLKQLGETLENLTDKAEVGLGQGSGDHENSKHPFLTLGNLEDTLHRSAFMQSLEQSSDDILQMLPWPIKWEQGKVEADKKVKEFDKIESMCKPRKLGRKRAGVVSPRPRNYWGIPKHDPPTLAFLEALAEDITSQKPEEAEESKESSYDPFCDLMEEFYGKSEYEINEPAVSVESSVSSSSSSMSLSDDEAEDTECRYSKGKESELSIELRHNASRRSTQNRVASMDYYFGEHGSPSEKDAYSEIRVTETKPNVQAVEVAQEETGKETASTVSSIAGPLPAASIESVNSEYWRSIPLPQSSNEVTMTDYEPDESSSSYSMILVSSSSEISEDAHASGKLEIDVPIQYNTIQIDVPIPGHEHPTKTKPPSYQQHFVSRPPSSAAKVRTLATRILIESGKAASVRTSADQSQDFDDGSTEYAYITNTHKQEYSHPLRLWEMVEDEKHLEPNRMVVDIPHAGTVQDNGQNTWDSPIVTKEKTTHWPASGKSRTEWSPSKQYVDRQESGERIAEMTRLIETAKDQRNEYLANERDRKATIVPQQPSQPNPSRSASAHVASNQKTKVVHQPRTTTRYQQRHKSAHVSVPRNLSITNFRDYKPPIVVPNPHTVYSWTSSESSESRQASTASTSTYPFSNHTSHTRAFYTLPELSYSRLSKVSENSNDDANIVNF